MEIQITEHAKERAKERLHLNEKSLLKLAERAYEKGLSSAITKGTLRKYLDKIFLEHKAGAGKIYGECLFIFSKTKLITLYIIPSELKRYTKIFKN